jgi:hypothetical protein
MKSLLPVIVLALSVFSSTPSLADIITLKDGTIVSCEVIRETESEIVFSGELFGVRSEAHRIPRLQVLEVRREPRSRGDWAPSPAGESDPPLDVPPASRSMGKVPGQGARAGDPAGNPVAPPEVRVSEVDAAGATIEEAEKRGLRAAVEQVVGTLVLAEDRVVNDELIQSKIISVAEGFVERFERIGDPKVVDGLVRVRIRAWVRVSEVATSLRGNAIAVRSLDVKSVLGERDTKRIRDEEAMAGVRELFANWPNEVLSVGVTYAEGDRPRLISTGDADSVEVELLVRVSVDPDRWSAWMDRADRLFRSMGVEPEEGWWEFPEDSLPLPRWWPTSERSRVVQERDRMRIERLIPRPGAWAQSWVMGQSFGKVWERPGALDSGTVMLRKPKEKPVQYRLPERYTTEIDRLSSALPEIELEIRTADGDRAGVPIRDWTETVEVPSGSQSVTLWGGHVGRTRMYVHDGLDPAHAGPIEWSGRYALAVPRVRVGSAWNFVPLLPIGGEGYMICTPQIEFPFRFYLDRTEWQDDLTVSVALRPPARRR